MREFLAMSGYGAYVWSCYALALVVVVFNVWHARRDLREQQLKVQRRAQMQREESQS